MVTISLIPTGIILSVPAPKSISTIPLDNLTLLIVPPVIDIFPGSLAS